jgi:hypothetical protein
VTCLYGPLQTRADKSLRTLSSSPVTSSRISKSNSFLNKKPILKKRSISEIMLQKPLSSSSTLKQAEAESPDTERKHIHFNKQVKQCIALDVKGADDEPEPKTMDYGDDNDSDDGGIMMKRTNSNRKLPPLHRPTTLPPANNDSKTIAMLPSTTLKHREDSPKSHETAMKNRNGFWNGSRLSPCPSTPPARVFQGDDEEDNADMDWQPPSFFGCKDNTAATQGRFQNLHTSESSNLSGEPSGMRRTPSRMFMPCEKEEEAAVSEGLFRTVVDTVNTAKDIAHLIWNVGWRK